MSKYSDSWSEQNQDNFEYYYKSYKYGTYAQVSPTDETKKTLKDIIKKVKPKNAIDDDDFHVTLVFSIGKGNPTLQPSNDVEYKAYADSFALFGPNKDVLVIQLESEDLNSRHEYLLNSGFLRHSYQEYRPHITLGYEFDGKLPDKEKLLRKDSEKIELTFKGETIDSINPDFIQ